MQGNGAALKRWVEAGGALITFGGATAWATREDVGATTARRIVCEPKKDVKPAPAARAPIDSLRAVASPNACADELADLPGSHFDVVLDLTNWVTFGMEQQRMPVLVGGGSAYGLARRRQCRGLPDGGPTPPGRLHLPREQRAPAARLGVHHH